MKRREFLQITGATLALAVSDAQGQGPEDSTAGVRHEPANPVMLRTNKMEVRLDRQDGLPFDYRFSDSPARLFGENVGLPVIATVCERGDWKISAQRVRSVGVKSTLSTAEFSFHIALAGRDAAIFVIRYELQNSTLRVSLPDVEERTGFELIEVALPQLATIREQDGEAWLAHGDDGGNFVRLAEARTGELAPNTFWGRVHASLPLVMIGTPDVICMQETTALMDSTTLSVNGAEGSRSASLGTVQNYRVNGSLCYDMNTGTGTPRSCGNSSTPNLVIGQNPECRLDFLTRPDVTGPLDWLAAAKHFRSRMPAIPTKYYDDKFIYSLRIDEPKFEQPASTFAESEEVIRTIARLTDGAPQIAHLWGWQYRGKDTGYPAVYEVNKRAGGRDAMMRVLANAPKYNCRATLSDNYDDAYQSSPAWDPAIVAKRPDGELWESRNWTGENSYILGLAKFMSGPGPERVKFTAQNYDLKDTIHVDVLSYYTIRNDWDRERPASGIKNLFEGRYKVLDEFKKYGLDVSSEAMRYAVIGKISMFWHITGARACPFGGEPIPLQPLVYRKSASWGEANGSGTIQDRLLNLLFYNGFGHLIIRKDTDPRDITDLYYFLTLPWIKLHSLNTESLLRDGGRTIIGLEENSSLDLDWDKKSSVATWRGYEILRDLTVTCPLDDRRIACYSADDREISVPLPKDWDSSRLTAFEMSVEGAAAHKLQAKNGAAHLHISARQPVILYRDGAPRSWTTEAVRRDSQGRSFRGQTRSDSLSEATLAT